MSGKRRLYVLDTSVVLPLLRKSEADIVRREKLHGLLSDNREAVFAVTAPGLAESFDTPLPAGIHVLDMTMQAGVIAASIRRAWYNDLHRKDRRVISPHMAKIDHLILATAEAWSATALYTEDQHFARIATLAKLKVDIRALPSPPKQGELWS